MLKIYLQRQKPVYKRLVVGWIALYPTLIIVLFLLRGVTQHLSMPMAILIEVIVIVPVTQLISFPIAGKVFAKWLKA
jgi:antibiotic biosynthesis monooxygenase (ABM) superfamily enzyme